MRSITNEPIDRLGENVGFRQSFESFYAREIRAVVGLAYVLSGSRSSAEDLAQEGFLAAYRKWDVLVDYDNAGAWVRKVVANSSVSAFRRARVEMRTLVRLRPDEYVFPEIPAESEYLWEEVRRLPTRQKQAVALRFVDRRAIAEIARIFDCSENTVKTHLRRAQDTLSKRLGYMQEDS